jgi:hypothetical protein
MSSIPLEALYRPIPDRQKRIGHAYLRSEDADEAIANHQEIAGGCISFWEALRRGHSLIPPSVFPSLFNKESRDVIQGASYKIWRDFGVATQIDFVVNSVYFAPPIEWFPWEVSLNFAIGKFGIWGPMLVSMGHRVMADPRGNSLAKKDILDVSLGELMVDHSQGKHLIAISMPKRAPDSFTHQVFTQDYGAHCRSTSETSSRYYFAGDNSHEADVEEALKDSQLHEVFNIIGRAWSENFARETARWKQSGQASPINWTVQFMVDALLLRKTIAEVNTELGIADS